MSMKTTKQTEAANRITEALANGDEAKAKQKTVALTISPPKILTTRFLLIGTTPLVQHRFGAKAQTMIQTTQEEGSVSKKGKKREPKDFDVCFNDARHISTEKWDGIHAAGFRRAMIDACKLCGFHMTKAKLGVFVVADGHSADGTPLVRITKGEPRKVIHYARNSTGVIDLRGRPMWDPGWQCILTVSFDADMFSVSDVYNLLLRVGMQCGIGEGRPNSKESAGCGWGLFDVKVPDEDEAK